MGKIVALGGGEIRLKETLPIDRFIVEFSETPTPKLLFIPTASGDSPGYVETIKTIYGEQLGCEVDALLLVNNEISEKEIERKILSADIIYVGGGSTSKMMEIWRRNRVDEYLKKAYENNIVLSGLSAGSICWFLKGHTDSYSKNNPGEPRDHAQIRGIGLIPAIHCPHYNEKGRTGFDDMMKTEMIPGIAIEDNCAFVIKDDLYKIIKSDSHRKAYLLKNYGGKVNKWELDAFEFSPLSTIYH